jgi:hypothetical protein
MQKTEAASKCTRKFCKKIGNCVDPIQLSEQLVDFHHTFPMLVKTISEEYKSRILSRKIVGVKATMTGQRMKLYAETNLAGHACFSWKRLFRWPQSDKT